MMVIASALVIACALFPNSLAETPEWRAYRVALGKLSTYRVSYVGTMLWPTDAGDCSVQRNRRATITLKAGGAFVLETQTELAYWNGSSTVAFDKRTGVKETKAGKPDFYELMLLDLPVQPIRLSPDRSISKLSRLTREATVTDERSGKTIDQLIVGWSLETKGRPDNYDYEFWFDPDTHLLVKVVETARGSVPSYRCEYSFEWDVAPNLPKDYFLPLALPAYRAPQPDLPSSRLVYRTADGPAAGKGRLVCNIPAGAEGTVEVGQEAPLTEFRSVGGRLALSLNPGHYKVVVCGVAMDVQVLEGMDAVCLIGGVKSTRKTAVTLLDWKRKNPIEVRPGSKPFAVVAGTYYVLVGDNIKMVIVAPGKITSL
jgi:hypothetical protein